MRAPKTQTPHDAGSVWVALRSARSEADWLADKGEVVIPAGGVRNRRAAVGRDAQLRRVGHVSAVCRHRSPTRIADADGVAGIAAAVDVADLDGAATAGSRRHAAVARRRGICELHGAMPSLRLPCVDGFASPPRSGRPRASPYGLLPLASIALKSRPWPTQHRGADGG